ncbi:hypothetical protein Aph01nite_74070 [Acrocarpospora phusangensis]|uniref:Phage tail tape measure protein domain-containing protein n=1 Tax=Acrocarpospora phusangensis TaxID=1070424 RepID=A0A919QMY5_9ACTN|nr:phage tail tape measure protein [Acrocarpospora phusangensis]GIH29097.1 hypothetical protein Aph01nite_74070 [Acrocarpospora phusangensis]
MSDTSLVFNILARDQASATFDKIKGHAAVAGVAIGAALAAGVGQALERSKSDALLAAQLGAGPAMAATLGEASGRLYSRGVVDSIETGNAAIRGAIQNGLVAPDASAKAIDDVAAKIANLGAVMEEDAGRVSAAVSQMLRTGIAGSAEEAFDLLQAATQKGLNKSQDLLDTVNEYGTQFRSMGLSGQQALGLISQAMQAGARDSDVVADTIKEFAIEAVAGGERVRAGFTAVGLSAQDMVDKFAAGGPTAAAAFGTVLERLRGIKDPADRNAAAIALFGTKAEDMAGALSAMNLSTATAALGSVGGAADRAGQSLEQSAGAKVEALRRGLEEGLVTALAATAGWIEQNSGLVQTLGIVLGPLVAIVLVIVAATKVWTVVQTALNVAMMANPIGLIIIAIVALVAIVVLAWNKSETFRNIVTSAWQAVWDKIKAVGAWFSDTLWPAIKSVWDSIGNGAGAVWTTLKGWWDKIIDFFTSIPGRISKVASGMWDGIKDAFKSAINWLIEKWNNFSISIPAIDIPGIGRVGGFSLDTPNIPLLAEGGIIQRSGLAIVGERGPELLSLQAGAKVSPLRDEPVMAPAGRGGVTQIIYATIQVPPTADKGSVGRELNEALAAYRRGGGRLASNDD